MKELLAAIDKEGTIITGGLTVNIRVTDVKQSYGRTRYLVTPISGDGEVWVESVSFKK
jgi:uncharacterized protein (AIM24 family)